jgi:DNA-binding transcriptional LysR family regulator
MDLRILRYFTVIAQEKNITRAARKLCMSQPPLSHQIKLLEEELGTPLFIRSTKGLELTDEGQFLFQRAQQLLALSEKTEQDLRKMREGVSGSLSLGMVEGRAPYLAARWIAGFCRDYPQVRYDLWNGSGDDVIDRLEKGLLDLAIIAAPYDGERLEGFSVGRELWTALIPRTHPLARSDGDGIALSALVGQPLILPSRRSRIEEIRGWFDAIHAEPTILCTTSNYLDAVAMSELGTGIAIFPQTTFTPNDYLVTMPIAGPAHHVSYLLVWNKNQHLAPAPKAFVRYVRALAEKNAL